MTAVLTPAAPIMTEMTIKNSTEDMIYDRSYRIRHNKNQVSSMSIGPKMQSFPNFNQHPTGTNVALIHTWLEMERVELTRGADVIRAYLPTLRDPTDETIVIVLEDR